MRRFSFALLDGSDRPLRSLDGVTGGRAEVVAQSPLGGSGDLVIEERGQGIDWLSHRIQVTFHDGDVSWPVGTFLFAAPTARHTAVGVTYDVGLLTKMNIPAEDTTDARHTVTAGSAIIPEVVALIQSTGESRIAATDTGATLTADLTWDAGESKLKIINDLLQAAGYWSLWCDGAGQFRVEPYVNPQDRPVAHRFVHGPTSIHYPDWQREQDLASVPNLVVVKTHGDADSDGLVGVAKNEDPGSPFSFQARGRWISPRVETVEADSQATIDLIAARKLRDLMDPVAKLAVTHDMIPLEPNHLVEFIPEDGVTRLATVQRMSFDFRPFTDIRAEWREVL